MIMYVLGESEEQLPVSWQILHMKSGWYNLHVQNLLADSWLFASQQSAEDCAWRLGKASSTVPIYLQVHLLTCTTDY